MIAGISMGAFDGAIRTTGDLAGVFEYDDVEDRLSATAYFYLVQIANRQAGLVINSIHICSGAWAIDEADIAGEMGQGLTVRGPVYLWRTLGSLRHCNGQKIWWRVWERHPAQYPLGLS
ncbi:hypothetical protein MES5069_770062 [Mesorhizobium escarrei]|uniref:Uncharacterized protein n=1 Tax=Mesorhizobium escarrei TaxID=666018 RepID=A0ABM9EIJ5_9HYPH|nr:hypothetical protein MES5069_770062 [Mesorhizobium escarrei]